MLTGSSNLELGGLVVFFVYTAILLTIALVGGFILFILLMILFALVIAVTRYISETKYRQFVFIFVNKDIDRYRMAMMQEPSVLQRIKDKYGEKRRKKLQRLYSRKRIFKKRAKKLEEERLEKIRNYPKPLKKLNLIDRLKIQFSSTNKKKKKDNLREKIWKIVEMRAGKKFK